MCDTVWKILAKKKTLFLRMGCSSHFQNPGTPIIADNDDDGTAEL